MVFFFQDIPFTQVETDKPIKVNKKDFREAAKKVRKKNTFLKLEKIIR